MTTLTTRDRLGARTILFDPETGAHASDLGTLLERVPAARAAGLDCLGVDAAWGLADAPDHTCLNAVRAVPPGASLVLDEGKPRVDHSRATSEPARTRASSLSSALSSLLVSTTARALENARAPVVALGGGIDAPLVVLAARRAGVAVDHAIHLSVPGTTYEESDAARATASVLGLSLHEISLTAADLAASLPRAVRLAGTPFYNMHPVSRAIVGRVARERGHDVLLTGDGADQASRGGTERADYVPIVTSITRGCGLVPASPFVDDALVDLLADLSDPRKEHLRELARSWRLDVSIAERPKVPCWAPPLPRSAFPGADTLEALSRLLGRPLAWTDDDRSNVRIASLASFIRGFEIA